MKNLIVLSMLMLCFAAVYPQNKATSLWEYMPAPGQHMNMEQIGTPAAAQNMLNDESSLVSLGGCGGYIIAGFDQPCLNDPENPYDIDFTIFGNAFAGSSEPGVVWVMNDKNQNGLPDDTWYEIAGSSHFHPQTKRNYKITYNKITGREIKWTDNHNGAGIMVANTFNLQDYYPAANWFPDYPADSVTFNCTRLHGWINDNDPQELKIVPPAFGYADNRPKIRNQNLSLPDNPYTAETEGAGGDPIDISWAIDSGGQYVDLEVIHFVKIATGYQADLKHLGEVSTDISYVVDVTPDPSLTGKKNMLVIYPFDDQLLSGRVMQLEARYFESGRISSQEPVFTSASPEIIAVSETGAIKAIKKGVADIIVAAGDETVTFSLEVIEPESIVITDRFSAVYPGDTVLLEALVYSADGLITGLTPEFTNLSPDKGEIITFENKKWFVATAAGSVALNCTLQGYDIESTVAFDVKSSKDQVRIYVTVKTEDQNLLPLQWIDVAPVLINDHVENRTRDYSGLTETTLAHAVIAALYKSDVSFHFRDDESSGGKLYLYSAEKNGMFYYSWGGRVEPKAFARGWIATHNNSQYINNFDEVHIAGGDTVMIYHESNITEPWILTRLLSGQDSAAEGETVTLLYEEAVCIYNNEQVSSSAFTPVGNFFVSTQSSVFAGQNGIAEYILDQNPPLIFSAGNDAVLVSAGITTSGKITGENKIRIFPNPADQELYIYGDKINGAEAAVFNSSGMIVAKYRNISSGYRINTDSYPSGLYLLIIEGRGYTNTIKFVRK